MTHPISPLSQNGNVLLMESYAGKTIIEKWKSQFEIDVSSEIAGIEEIIKYKCLESELIFYQPHGVEGTSEFYAKLGKSNWYYPSDKWEHKKGVDLCNQGEKVLEVGCGNGEFLELISAKNVEAVGIEINSEAVKRGKELGLNITDQELHEFSKNHEREYDCVFAFQVLEHVPNPLRFIEDCLRTLKPGGLLVYATPNSKSFIRHVEWMLLDMPPHHMTGWNEEAYRYLPKRLPVSIQKIIMEPLAEFHIDFYLSTINSLISKTNLKLIVSIYHIFKPLIKKFLYAGGRYFIGGQGMLAVISKN